MTYTDAQDLTFGQRYTYVVVALDEHGRPSPPSNRVVVALAAAPAAPPRVEAQPGDAQVRLTWDAPADAGRRVAGAGGPRLRRVPGDDARHAGRPAPQPRARHLPPVRRPGGPERRDLSLRRARAARARRRPERAERGRHRDAGGRHPARPAARASWRSSPDRPSASRGRPCRTPTRRLPRLPEHDGGPGPRAADRGAPGRRRRTSTPTCDRARRTSTWSPRWTARSAPTSRCPRRRSPQPFPEALVVLIRARGHATVPATAPPARSKRRVAKEVRRCDGPSRALWSPWSRRSTTAGSTRTSSASSSSSTWRTGRTGWSPAERRGSRRPSRTRSTSGSSRS